MIEEYGQIIALKSERVALVECARQSACEHCPSASACNMGDDQHSMQVEALNLAGAGLYDRVKIVTSTSNFMRSSLLLYMVPVLALVITAYLGQELARNYLLTVDPSLASALCGVAGLILAFLGIRRLTRNARPEHYMPKIVAIVPVAKAQETK